MLRNYLKVAIRNLLRYKEYSAINIIGLAIGMACCTLIMLWVLDEISFDSFHIHQQFLYRVVVGDADNPEREPGSTIPYALTPLLADQYPEIVNFTRVQNRSSHRSVVLKYQDKLFYEPRAFMVDSSFLQMFSFPLAEGNPTSALSDPYSIVITEQLARKYFQNEDPIGKSINVNNAIDLKVTGVINSIPRNSELQFDCLFPIQLLGDWKLSTWHWETKGYVMLEENASVPDLQQKIAGIIQQHRPYPGQNFEVKLQPITKVHLYHGSGDIKQLYIFSLVAFFILGIACINYMNLSTARYSKRAKEVSVRKVVGAGRSHLVRQFLGETILLALISMLVAVTFIELLLPLFNNLTAKQLILHSPKNIPLALGLLMLSVCVGVVSGSYPALFLSSFQPVAVLKNKYASNRGMLTMRSVFVVIQFSIAIVLIICTFMIYKQHNFMIKKELGFEKEQILYLTINRGLKENYNAFKDKLLKNSDIASVTVASSLPAIVGNVNPIKWAGKKTDDEVPIPFAVTDHDYVRTFQMNIVEGRDFSTNIATDTASFILNRKAIEHLELKDPIGTQVEFMGAKGEIIGIVDNFHNLPLNAKTRPLILTINPDNYNYFLKYVFVKVRGVDLINTISYIEETSKEFAADYPFDYSFLDERINMIYASVMHVGSVINSFAFLAIFISCLGLLGLAYFISEQRTKEMGVRKVFGASLPGIVFLMSKDFVKRVLIANIIAWPVAYYACTKFLESFAYKTPISANMFIYSAVFALAIALITIGVQAIKAAVANPVDSLKYE